MIRKVGEAPLTVLQKCPYGMPSIELADLERLTQRNDGIFICDLYYRHDIEAKPLFSPKSCELPISDTCWNYMEARHRSVTFLSMDPVLNFPEIGEVPQSYYYYEDLLSRGGIKSYLIETNEHQHDDRTRLRIMTDDRGIAGNIFDELAREINDDLCRKPQVGQKSIFDLVAGRYAEYCVAE